MRTLNIGVEEMDAFFSERLRVNLNAVWQFCSTRVPHLTVHPRLPFIKGTWLKKKKHADLEKL